MCMLNLLGICLTTLQLTGGGISLNDKPVYEKAYAYIEEDKRDNLLFNPDISKFYTPKDPKVNVNGYAVINKDIKLDFSFNNGLKTKKLEVTNKKYIGINKYFIDKKQENIFIIGGSTSWGGDLINQPCTDSVNREYYCATLNFWDGYKGKIIDNPVENTISIKYIYKF